MKPHSAGNQPWLIDVESCNVHVISEVEVAGVNCFVKLRGVMLESGLDSGAGVANLGNSCIILL